MKLPEIIPDSQRQDEQQFDKYLFDLFLDDYIERQILRMQEFCSEKSSNLITLSKSTSHDLQQQ